MRAEYGEPLTVAFADEYEEERSGPFHFLDTRNEQAFSQAFAECKARKVGSSRFRRDGDQFIFRTSWANIPTESHKLSYYALCLPEWAIPQSIKFADPRSGREYSRTIVRDDLRKRFVLYLECRSSHGFFDFVLDVDFSISPDRFAQATFKDDKTTEYGAHLNAYEYLLPEPENVVVQQFFRGGDRYVVNGQAGAVGPNAAAQDLSFLQTPDSKRVEESPILNDDRRNR